MYEQKNYMYGKNIYGKNLLPELTRLKANTKAIAFCCLKLWALSYADQDFTIICLIYMDLQKNEQKNYMYGKNIYGKNLPPELTRLKANTKAELCRPRFHHHVSNLYGFEKSFRWYKWCQNLLLSLFQKSLAYLCIQWHYLWAYQIYL